MLSLIIYSLFLSPVLALWPVPTTYSLGNSTVVLAREFAIEFNPPRGQPPAGCIDTSIKIWAAIQRTYDLLNDGFVPYMLYEFEEGFEPMYAAMLSAQQLTTLVITQR